MGNYGVGGQPDLEHAERLPPHLRLPQSERLLRSTVPVLDEYLPIEDDDRRGKARHDLPMPLVDLGDLGHPVAELLIGRLELLVGGLVVRAVLNGDMDWKD